MWPFSRKGPSGFSASSTAEEVTQGIDGSGLTAIVTGASSGIGTETSRVLALRGVHVVLGVRNVAAGKDVKEAIVKEIPTAKVDTMELDLSSMASVRKFASEFNSSSLPLNILINNAGVMMTPFTLSKDNIELQFATNHLGHFLLTHLLLDTMKKTARQSSKEGRIVNVSSEAHWFTYREGIRFNKLNDQSGYNSVAAYGQSKLSNILHANELTTHLKEDGVDITANSLHPGSITTNLFRHSNIVNGFVNMIGRFVLKNAQQGAATTCYVALHPQVKGVSGEYFSDSNLSKASSRGASSGIGTETARVLALRGVHVVMGVRNMTAGGEVKEAIVKGNPTAKIDAMELDLSTMASVRKFAAEFNSSGLPLNILINNAGVMATPFMLSKDNIELQFATNHLGHFLLTNLLLETMKKTARETSREGRVVNVSSRRHQFSYREGIRFDKINDPSGYNSLSAYGQSKLANVLHANELARQLKEDRADIIANSLHPGAIATNLFRHYSFVSGLVGILGKYVIKNVPQGAATTCYVALHPQIKGMSGHYFADSNKAEASPQANDTESAKKLWNFSLNLIDRCTPVS